MSRIVAALTVLASCSGGSSDGDIIPRDSDPTIEPPPDDTGTDTGTTIDGGSIDATFWAVTGRFVFDQESVLHTTYAVPGEGLKPLSIEFMLIDSSWLVNPVLNDTTRCLVRFEWETPTGIADWVEPHFAWTGMDMPPAATVDDQCSKFFGLPAEWNGDAASHLSDWTWGVGVGPLDELVEDTLRNVLDESQFAALEPYLVGGTLDSSFLVGSTLSEDGFTDSGIALGYAVDSNFEVEIGGTGSLVPISNAYVNQDPGVFTGYYEVQMGPYTNAVQLTLGGG
jgi:hypothetical protein